MPRFFFDVVSRSRAEYDSGGTLLSDTDEARKWAQLLALTLRAENEKHRFVDGRVDVRGPDGLELFSIAICHLETDLDKGLAGWSELREDDMKLPRVKRSILTAGVWSSVSLEEAFWKGLKAIAADRGLTLFALVGTINAARHHANLSSAIRLFVLDYYRSQIGGVSDEQGSAQRHKPVPETHTSLTVTTTPAKASRAVQP